MCKSNCCQKTSDIGMFVLRVFVGGTFLFHGIFKAIHMGEANGTIDFFTQIGFNAFWAYVVTIVEIGAGAALVLGILSLYSSILLAIVMAMSAFKVKWGIPGAPFLARYLASEFDLALLASLIAIALIGPGSWSLWKMCKCKCHGTGSPCKVCKVVGCKDCSSCDSSKKESPVSENPTV